MLLRFGVEKFGTLLRGGVAAGLSPTASVIDAPSPEADGAMDGASMPSVLESPRSWFIDGARTGFVLAVPGRFANSFSEIGTAVTADFFHMLS